MMQGGTNLPKIRDYNQGVVLEAVRTGEGASRVEIAEKTGLTAQTVSNIVRRLLDEGLIVEAGVTSSSGGKPRTILQIKPDARYAVGVLVDRDEVALVIMALDGRIMARSRHALHPEQGPQMVLGEVSQAVQELVSQTEIDREKILGLGVGYPGPMNHETGVVFEPFDLMGWGQIHLKEILQELTGYPVIVDNDANVAAIGERWAGETQGAANFAFIFMGMGVGAGLFIQNQIYRGSTTNAGEFGHMTMNVAGPECFCGNQGCLEVYCSPARIIKAVRERLEKGEASCLEPENLTLHCVTEAALVGDKVAREEIERSARMLARGVVSIASLLDLELVILGGKALGNVGEIYQTEAQRALDERLITRNVRRVCVELSHTMEEAGAVGAAALVLHEIYTPRLTGLGVA
jgi:predicted NBD/HSP70 family sugar kinase